MAVVGNAKNARVVVNCELRYGEELRFELTARGNKYRFNASDNAGWSETAAIYRQPSTSLASKSGIFAPTMTVEVVDNRLRMWEGTGTFESADVTSRLEAFDNTHLVAGAWDLTYGTLVSFESLDAPSTIAVTGVTLNKATTSLAPLATEQLTATVAPADATDKTVSWNSSNPAIATVSATGLVTAVAAGSVTITVTTADGGFTATCEVSVIAPLSIYLGGTTGATDGVREIPNDGAGITVGEGGESAVAETFHMRCHDNQHTNVAITVNAPPHCAVSKTGSAETYTQSVVYAAGEIGDTNVPCYVIRTEQSPAMTTGLKLTPRLSNVTADILWLEPFVGDNINTELWTPLTAGSGSITVSGGQAHLKSATDTDGMLLYRKAPLVLNENRTYRWKTRINSDVTNDANFLLAIEDTDVPFAPNAATANPTHATTLNAETSTVARGRLWLLVTDNAALSVIARSTRMAGGTNRFYDSTTSSWSPTTSGGTVLPIDTFHIVEFQTTASLKWRIRVYAADGVTLKLDSSLQEWTGITAFSNSPYLIIGGEPYTTATTASSTIEWYDEVSE